MSVKCSNCQWPFPNVYHICQNIEEVRMRDRKAINVLSNRKAPSSLSDSHKRNLAESQRIRWAKIREARKPIYEAMVARYAQGDIGVIELAREFKMGRDRTLKVLKEAAAEGKITMRRVGATIAKGATNVQA